MGQRGEYPDVLAYPIDEAIRVSESWGLEPHLLRTVAPKRSGTGRERVIRVRLTQDKTVLELMVAAEDWGQRMQ
ncbi:MAG: hypothetical protein NUK65_10465 [Firmicutes bacterium]|nr:hypothetical protein [Bacillota bacterium]